MATTTATNVDVHHLQLQENIGTKIVLGGAANSVSCFVTHPCDVIKIRLQLQALTPMHHAAVVASGTHVVPTRYLGFSHGLQTILKEEGLAGWYKGLKASLIRESCYSGIRFGLYDVVKEKYEEMCYPHSEPPEITPLYIKMGAGATTGAVGSAIMNPMDLVKVRMQSDRTGTRYQNRFLYACRDIYSHDGLIKGFYRGVGPTTFRAMVLTATQLPSYDHMKAVLLHRTSFEEGIQVHMIASMFAGLVAATASSPLDVIKTKIMNECSKTATSASDFQSSQLMRKVFTDVVRTEGIRGFFKGWLPNWLRLGPHTIISLMLYEEFRKAMNLEPV